MTIKTVGSVCSGIEAASVAWESLGLSFEWFSEIAPFPSKVLSKRYPTIPNHGDMNNLPISIINGTIASPDLICGGTPCQAFSLAGWKSGLNDERGNLTLRFTEIIEANDTIRSKQGNEPSIVLWENVEGVLTDKTNAFGCFISTLAGCDNILNLKHWPNAGILKGAKRNVAWRVLDAKYFGVPQQRRRLYVLAGGKNFAPESALFEKHAKTLHSYPASQLTFYKDNHYFETFREYTDCLYSAYGTKWNGNAAAYNGSLFVIQDSRIRRFSPLECERLMGFPDDYTNIEGAKRTHRYQTLGNSWAVPVIRWIGQRLLTNDSKTFEITKLENCLEQRMIKLSQNELFFDFGKDIEFISEDLFLNCSVQPENCIFAPVHDIVSSDAPESIYISSVGCHGILRRSQERNISINPALKNILTSTSSQMSANEIERKSRVQKRGKYGNNPIVQNTIYQSV